MPSRTIDLTDQENRFLDASISEGRFNSASEAVSAALHLLERKPAEDEARLEWLREAVREGIEAVDRGEYTTLSSSADIEQYMNEVHAEVMAEPRVRA